MHKQFLCKIELVFKLHFNSITFDLHLLFKNVFSHHFVISPALPDNLSGISLRFKELNMPFKKDQAVLEFEFQLD